MQTFIPLRTFKPFDSDDEVAAIGSGLIDLTLPKSAWTHAAHFAATIWLLSCRNDLDAARDMPQLIRRYNEATGAMRAMVFAAPAMHWWRPHWAIPTGCWLTGPGRGCSRSQPAGRGSIPISGHCRFS
jgi:hypothetical protein